MRELLRGHRAARQIACDHRGAGGHGLEQALALPLAHEVRGTGSCRLFADLVDSRGQ